MILNISSYMPSDHAIIDMHMATPMAMANAVISERRL